ncbi:hypothetical protein AAHE18_08G241000 [Arachis hypogaea]|nr:uncharacterized protein DS421_8g251950 [Arachis hypogaea]
MPQAPNHYPSNRNSITPQSTQRRSTQSLPSPSSSCFLSPPASSVPHFRPAAGLIPPPSQVVFEATVAIVQLCSTFVQLPFQLWKHRRRARLLPPSRSSVPPVSAVPPLAQDLLCSVLVEDCFHK